MTELVLPIKRVEQYLYALCVLDFSNIPVPRSRLEIFTHAMITGELPEIAPETREEEYMVAIIKGDVANLPTPKSRADHLLYRICLGETEIRDIELETRYEMLLAYLAEHGGTDLEYALINYTKAFETLYNTVEMPFKSAILKGQTLVNLSEINYFSLSGRGSSSTTSVSSKFKTNTDYTRIIFITKNTLTGVNENGCVAQPHIGAKIETVFFVSSDDAIAENFTGLLQKRKFTTPSNISTYKQMSGIRIYGVNTGGILEGYEIILEGDYTNVDIPYFEGMQSVKMPVLTTTGKNLLINDWENGGFSLANGTPVDSSNTVRSKTFSKVSSATNYVVSMENHMFGQIFYYDKNYNFISRRQFGENNLKITTPDNCEYIKVQITSTTTNVKIQFEEGRQATSYEPHKSNILTVNEDIELRGIGDVKDELDLMTGKLTQRIGEIVLDGSQSYRQHTSQYFTTLIRWVIPNIITTHPQITDTTSHFSCDKMITETYESFREKEWEFIAIENNGKNIHLMLNVDKAKTTEELKTYLSQNPITVQYVLETESVKTVDLTILDQNNQPTQLKTFNDVTHIETQADSVLPTVILEYGTKNQEVLAALSQDHEEVADAQAALSDAIDSQSDEVETTMMALTEVYEGGNEE